MTTATIDVSEGCCGGPWDSDGTFIRYTAELENTGAETMNIDTLRVTFDPRDLEWNDGADTNPSDSVFDSYTDGGAFGPNEEPISDDPTL
jgi:hypothetical protein